MVGVGDKQKMQLDGGKGYKWLRSGCVRSQNEVGGVRTFRPKDALSFTQTVALALSPQHPLLSLSLSHV